MVRLTRQQAAELGELGIRSNCVAPGPVDTKLALAVHTPEIRAAYHDAVAEPLAQDRRRGDRVPVLGQGGYVTGQTIAADGGFDANGVGLQPCATFDPTEDIS